MKLEPEDHASTTPQASPVSENETKTLDLESIRARGAMATCGPWLRRDRSVHAAHGTLIMSGYICDAEFIAHARQDIPALVAEVERLRAQARLLASWQGLLASWRARAVVVDGSTTCVNHAFYQCADELEAALSQPHQCEWKDAIIDACVVDWILTAEHETNPRKAVNDLLCWQQRLALDPAISEDAAKLHARIAELEAALASPPVDRSSTQVQENEDVHTRSHDAGSPDSVTTRRPAG